ncbi:glutamine synthetase family protein [Lysobacter enzymogenes]|uniref:glutamine synthetase family protein n=1 Tax=Lysobacter enzymogenes TaxID=69 RepID=UPI0037486E64
MSGPSLSSIATVEDVVRLIHARKPDHVNVGFADMPGQLRVKYVSTERFLAALEKGLCFAGAALALDHGDVQRPARGVSTGEGVVFGDRLCKIVPDSVREIPWESPTRNLLFLADFEEPEGPLQSRNLYLRVLARARAQGLRAFHSSEYEFTLFEETPRSIREKDYRDLRLATLDSSYHLMLRQGVGSGFYNALMDSCKCLDIPLEGVHEEMGAGFMEAALAYREGVRAADDAMLFKTAAKIVAQRHDKLITFMARWSNQADGQSGHIHVSLRDEQGDPLFYDPSQPRNMSRRMRHFVGGLQALLPEFLILFGPTVNSFRRYQPWIFSPVAASWGWENRTCALRLIGGSPYSQRIECRVPGADANPYLALACVLGAGLWGMEREIEPGEESTWNVYENLDKVAPKHRFPRSFGEAIGRFDASAPARELFGDRFVDAYVETKRAQDEEFAALVTDVELRRFFEFA